MKKILAIILALVICAAFAACEKKEANVSSAIAEGESSVVVSDDPRYHRCITIARKA